MNKSSVTKGSNHPITRSPAHYLPLLLILLTYLLLGSLYAIYTPDWQAPDEPAHYNYVKQLANGRFPRMEPGDYNEATKNEIVGSKFAPEYSIASFTYEDWQPPLYYLLLTPIFWLTGGSLLALRLFSLLIGAGIILFAYLVAHQFFYLRSAAFAPYLALGTAVFVAFLPQHLSILASVNNDALAELLIGAILYQLLVIESWRLKNNGRSLTANRPKIILGILLGLGFLTKGTVYPFALIVGFVLLRQARSRLTVDYLQLTILLRPFLLVFTPAFLLGSLWWGRNILVYGGLDILGKTAHDAVVLGQPRTADWITQMGLVEFLRRFLQTTWHSFWGQFGWMAVPMPGWVYAVLGVFTALVIAGFGVRLFQGRRGGKWTMDNDQSAMGNEETPRTPRLSTLILVATFLLTLAVYLGYNLTFVQHQGRYLFPALIPIGIGVMVGLEVWIRPFAAQRPFLPPLMILVLFVGFAGLDVLALFRFIVPNL